MKLGATHKRTSVTLKVNADPTAYWRATWLRTFSLTAAEAVYWLGVFSRQCSSLKGGDVIPMLAEMYACHRKGTQRPAEMRTAVARRAGRLTSLPGSVAWHTGRATGFSSDFRTRLTTRAGV